MNEKVDTYNKTGPGQRDGKPFNKAFKTLSVPELKIIAESLNIDVEGLRKLEIQEAIREADNDVIYPPAKAVHPKHNNLPKSKEEESIDEGAGEVTANASGVIISPQPEHKPKITKVEAHNEDVALFSERNLSVKGTGKIEKGFNFIPESKVDVWLGFRGIRKASAEEVAQHYGVK